MTLVPIEEASFTLDEPAPAHRTARAAASTDGGWVNLTPVPDPGTQPPRRNLFMAIFSSRGPELPLATISAEAPVAGHLSLGLQHPGGVKALARLAGRGLPLPDGWREVSDHPRRGLVVTAPAHQVDVGVDWLLAAARILTAGPLPTGWVARRYQP